MAIFIVIFTSKFYSSPLELENFLKAITIMGIKTIWQIMPGIAFIKPAAKKISKENVVFVSPISANLAIPQTIRPASIEIMRFM